MAFDSNLATCLEHLYASADFVRSGKTRRLLQFLVDAARDPLAAEPTERTLAERVFERGSDWDPKIDPVVRIAILRLRAKLEKYYETAGKDDPVRILLPKGGYAAQLVSQAEPASLAVPGRAPLRLWAYLASAAILLVVAAVWFQSQTQAKLQYPAFQVVPFATEIGTEATPAISPDGKWVAYVWDGNGKNFDIYLKSMDGGEIRRFTTDEAMDLNPAWSPDGANIAFLRSSGRTGEATALIVKPLNGGNERVVGHLLTETGRWTASVGPLLGDPGPAWSEDGGSLIYLDGEDQAAGPHGLVELNLATGGKKALTATTREIRDFYPRVSPDGKSLAFVRYESHGVGDLYVANRDGSSPIRLTFDRRTIRGVSWVRRGAHRGSLIYSSNRDGRFQLWQMARTGGAPALIPVSSSSAVDPFASAASDQLAFVEYHENWNIWKADVTNGTLKQVRRLISSSGRNYDPRYSPDGRRIAFLSDRSGSWQIWIGDTAGAGLSQITHFPSAWLGSLAWSPDGQRIAFDARPEGHASIYSVWVRTGEITRMTSGPSEERSPSWSRDGKAIYFNSNRYGPVAVYRRDLATGTDQRVSPPGAFTATESYDAKTLYIDMNVPGELLHGALDGSRLAPFSPVVKLFPQICFAVYPGGVVYAAPAGDDRSQLVRISGGVQTVLGETAMPIVPHTPSLSSAPDGSSLLWAQVDQTTSDIELRRGLIP